MEKIVDFKVGDNGIIQESPARQLACALLEDSSYSGVKYYEKEDKYVDIINRFMEPREKVVFTLVNCYDPEDIELVAIKASQAKEAGEIIVQAMKEWNSGVGEYPNGEYGNVFDYIYNSLDEKKIEYGFIAPQQTLKVDNECYIERINEGE